MPPPPSPFSTHYKTRPKLCCQTFESVCRRLNSAQYTTLVLRHENFILVNIAMSHGYDDSDIITFITENKHNNVIFYTYLPPVYSTYLYYLHSWCIVVVVVVLRASLVAAKYIYNYTTRRAQWKLIAVLKTNVIHRERIFYDSLMVEMRNASTFRKIED